jgi:predicted  nucleic acid-binding Zn-ribbon protein
MPLAARALIFVALLAVAAPAADAPAPESAADVSTRKLLEALEDKQMPDVALWVLERVAADKDTAESLKQEVPFRRAAALVGTNRTESDPKKRAAVFDEAEKQIDLFLGTGPEGWPAIGAFLQKGNLLIQRGRTKVEQAKRPGEDAAKVLAESVPFFEGAIKSLQGTTKPGAPIEKVASAEDAIVKALREADARVATVKKPYQELKDQATKAEDEAKGMESEIRQLQAPPRDKDAKDKAAAGPANPGRIRELQVNIAKLRKDAAILAREAKELEAEIRKKLAQPLAEQENLRTKLLQTRLMVAETYFEKAKAYDPKSKDWTASIDESTKRHQELADKYPTKGVGFFARYYEGRNLALVGERDKALSALAVIYEQQSQAPLVSLLRSKALNVALECWLADPKTLGQFTEPLVKFALTPPRPPNRLDADWLSMKYRAALALDARAAAMPETERAKRAQVLKDALKLSVDVATANREFAKEARELAAKLGKELPEGEGGGTLVAVVADAKAKVDAMREKQIEAKKLQAEGKQAEAEAALKEAGTLRDEATAKYEEALKQGEQANSDDPAVNQVRYMLTYLLYDGQKFVEAAKMGTLLAEKYPNAMGSRQAAKIAMACWQQLMRQPDAAPGINPKAKLNEVATLITKTWPGEAEAADAFTVIAGNAIESRSPAGLIAFVKELPKEAARRPSLLLRAGTALWREVREASAEDEAKAADWKAQARAALDEGLAALESAQELPPAPDSKVIMAAALSRVQMALEDGDDASAGKILEHPVYGPWTLANGQDPVLNQGPLAESTFNVATRYYIQAEQIDKAQKAMAGLERLAGKDEKSSDRLTAMYQSMGRELRSQLERLAAGGKTVSKDVRARADKILAGFEQFLDGLAKRDAKTSSQIWVATTYLSLGSGAGTGAVVAKAKAEQYLDRAAEVYKKLLERKGDPDVEKFEPSIRLKIANIYRERGKWDDALAEIDWFMSDKKRQNSLDAQEQAASLLQAAGRAKQADTKDAEADTLLREAATGRNGGAVWGWGGLANKLSRQAFAGNDEKALKMREQYFDAWLHYVECLLDRGRLPGKAADKKKRLDAAQTAVARTRRLYPDMGGEAMKGRFEKVLKEIQKESGQENPRGFPQLDEEAAQQAAAASAAAGGSR